jgi:hypothetical protein
MPATSENIWVVMALGLNVNGNCRELCRPASESVRAEIDGQDFDHALWVAARSSVADGLN